MEKCKICSLSEEQKVKYLLYKERLMAIEELKMVDLNKFQKYININEDFIDEEAKIMAKEAEDEISKINCCM